MPDFNPDKERHRKHKFIVQQAWPSVVGDDVESSKGTLKPNKQGRFVINDESLAREVQQQYPKEMTVTRMTSTDAADRGHNYFFGQLRKALPWHKYDKNGRRIRDTEPSESAESARAETPAEVENKEVQDA